MGCELFVVGNVVVNVPIMCKEKLCGMVCFRVLNGSGKWVRVIFTAFAFAFASKMEEKELWVFFVGGVGRVREEYFFTYKILRERKCRMVKFTRCVFLEKGGSPAVMMRILSVRDSLMKFVKSSLVVTDGFYGFEKRLNVIQSNGEEHPTHAVLD